MAYQEGIPCLEGVQIQEAVGILGVEHQAYQEASYLEIEDKVVSKRCIRVIVGRTWRHTWHSRGTIWHWSSREGRRW